MQQSLTQTPPAAARTKQSRRLIHPGKCLLRAIEFLKRSFARHLSQTTRMRPGVIPDPVPFAARPARQIQANGRADVLAQDEERGLHAMTRQAI